MKTPGAIVWGTWLAGAGMLFAATTPATETVPVATPAPVAPSNSDPVPRQAAGLHFAPGATEPVAYDMQHDIVTDERLATATPSTRSTRLTPAARSELAKAMEDLSTADFLKAGPYEIRVLNFVWQGARLKMLWLKPDGQGDNVFYLMPSISVFGVRGTRLEQSRAYPAAIFFAELHAAAKGQQDAAQAVEDRQAATFKENQYKAATGQDTVKARLLALQTALKSAQVTLGQAPEGARSFFSKALADLDAAQKEVMRALDYVKAHPEEDSLSTRLANAVMDGNRYDYGYNWMPLTTAGAAAEVARQTGFASLPSANNVLKEALRGFMGDVATGQPSPSGLGGARDIVMRRVAAAWLDVEAGGRNYLSALGLRPRLPILAASAASLAGAPANGLVATEHAGTLAGTVMRSDGKPAAYVVVAIRVVDSPAAVGKSVRMGEVLSLPGTISDANGHFAIGNLAPGFYAIAVDSVNWVVVEVKEQDVTQLVSPSLTLARRNVGGG